MKYSGIPIETVIEAAQESPGRLVVLFYDEAIASLRAAAAAAADNDVMARLDATTQTAEVIHQLQLALDLDRGGEIADNLDRLYSFVIVQLPQINLHNDVALAESLIGILEPLRRSWIELQEHAIDETAEAGAAGQAMIPVAVAAMPEKIAGAA